MININGNIRKSSNLHSHDEPFLKNEGRHIWHSSFVLQDLQFESAQGLQMLFSPTKVSGQLRTQFDSPGVLTLLRK